MAPGPLKLPLWQVNIVVKDDDVFGLIFQCSTLRAVGGTSAEFGASILANGRDMSCAGMVRMQVNEEIASVFETLVGIQKSSVLGVYKKSQTTAQYAMWLMACIALTCFKRHLLKGACLNRRRLVGT